MCIKGTKSLTLNNVAMFERDHQTMAKSILLYNYLVIFSLICVKLFFVVIEEKTVAVDYEL